MSTKRKLEFLAYAVFIAITFMMPLFLDEFWLNRIAKYLVFGMLGVAISLCWGYAGILNLGQGLFFGAGAYMLAMSLKLASPTSLAETIYRHGETMLLGLLERAPFRLIGIGISDLEEAGTDAAPPPDLFEADQTTRRRAEAATDEIRARFGKDAIIHGRALR